MTIGEKIKKVRSCAGENGKKITQEVFAASLDLNRNTIFQYETGALQPSTRTLKKICEVYNVNMGYFLNDDEDMFVDTAEIFAETLRTAYKLDDLGVSILKAYINMNDEEKKTIKKLLLDITKELE